MITKIVGFLGVVGALVIVYYFETSSHGTGIWRILHWPALVLTGLGPMFLLLVAADFQAIKRTLGVIFGATAAKRLDLHEREAILLQKVGKAFYNDGPQAFEAANVKGTSPYVKKMLDRLAMRMPMPDIRDLLESERDRVHVRLHHCVTVAGTAVKLTPSVGMLGTIMGMVNLLGNLSDPSKIGGSMSLALLTTFFGLFFSVVLWTPLQGKCERVTEIEVDSYNKALRWLELLEKRKPADYFADAAELPTGKQKKAS